MLTYRSIKEQLIALFIEMARARKNDLISAQKRRKRQLKQTRKLLLHRIPKNLRRIIELRALLTKQMIQNGIDRANGNLINDYLIAKRNLTSFANASQDYLQYRWEQLQPKLDNIVQTSFAITTATSTLQLTVQVTPIVLSVLTIMATAPIFNAILPDFLFNTTVLFFIMLAISAYAGYSKFKELETRAKLDKQIEDNQLESQKHKRSLSKLERRIEKLERLLANKDDEEDNTNKDKKDEPEKEGCDKSNIDRRTLTFLPKQKRSLKNNVNVSPQTPQVDPPITSSTQSRRHSA